MQSYLSLSLSLASMETQCTKDIMAHSSFLTHNTVHTRQEGCGGVGVDRQTIITKLLTPEVSKALALLLAIFYWLFT